jgi:dolichyl-phosphate-mannose--protein O-mannosyl transferase
MKMGTTIFAVYPTFRHLSSSSLLVFKQQSHQNFNSSYLLRYPSFNEHIPSCKLIVTENQVTLESQIND